MMSSWARVLLGVLGTAMLAVGSLATLTSTNGLGTVAVVVAGSIFLATATLGRWPSRVSWGDKVAEFYQEVVETALTTASPETQDEVREIVASAPFPSTTIERALDRATEAAAWGRWLVARPLIYKLAGLVPPEYAFAYSPREDHADKVHAVIRTGPKRAQWVGVIAITPATLDPVANVVSALHRGWRELIVVTDNYDDPQLLHEELEGMPRVNLIDLSSEKAGADIERLLKSVQTASPPS